MMNVFVHVDVAKTFAKSPPHVKAAIRSWKARLEQDIMVGQQILSRQIPARLAKKFTLEAL